MVMQDSALSWLRENDGAGDETIEANWLFQLRRERYVSRQSGRSHGYYVLHLADAVQVIAITPENEILLVRQFRAGSARDSLEPPGGLLDPGEDPLEAGARELREETGYQGDPGTSLCQVWSNPSIMTSRIVTIVITNARRVGSQELDEGEELGVEIVPASEIPSLIREGKIDHALAVLGFLWWMKM
jgi:8-oxo-dGTP pyrophosphatase MutT (NUDIX family)